MQAFLKGGSSGIKENAGFSSKQVERIFFIRFGKWLVTISFSYFVLLISKFDLYFVLFGSIKP